MSVVSMILERIWDRKDRQMKRDRHAREDDDRESKPPADLIFESTHVGLFSIRNDGFGKARSIVIKIRDESKLELVHNNSMVRTLGGALRPGDSQPIGVEPASDDLRLSFDLHWDDPTGHSERSFDGTLGELPGREPVSSDTEETTKVLSDREESDRAARKSISARNRRRRKRKPLGT